MFFLTLVTQPGTLITFSYPYTSQMIPSPTLSILTSNHIIDKVRHSTTVRDLSHFHVFIMSILTFLSLEYSFGKDWNCSFSRQALKCFFFFFFFSSFFFFLNPTSKFCLAVYVFGLKQNFIAWAMANRPTNEEYIGFPCHYVLDFNLLFYKDNNFNSL